MSQNLYQEIYNSIIIIQQFGDKIIYCTDLDDYFKHAFLDWYWAKLTLYKADFEEIVSILVEG